MPLPFSLPPLTMVKRKLSVPNIFQIKNSLSELPYCNSSTEEDTPELCVLLAELPSFPPPQNVSPYHLCFCLENLIMLPIPVNTGHEKKPRASLLPRL